MILNLRHTNKLGNLCFIRTWNYNTNYYSSMIRIIIIKGRNLHLQHAISKELVAISGGRMTTAVD